MTPTSGECWECGRPGTYWGDYALCDHCDTDTNRAKHEHVAKAAYQDRQERERFERVRREAYGDDDLTRGGRTG